MRTDPEPARHCAMSATVCWHGYTDQLNSTMGPRAVAYARGYEQGWSHHHPAERGVQAYWARQMSRAPFRLST
jgi:hypothetical protein